MINLNKVYSCGEEKTLQIVDTSLSPLYETQVFYEAVISYLMDSGVIYNQKFVFFTSKSSENFEKEFKEHSTTMRAKGRHSNKTDEELLGVYEFQKLMYLDFIKMFGFESMELKWLGAAMTARIKGKSIKADVFINKDGYVNLKNLEVL